jgi:hypothetical protein
MCPRDTSPEAWKVLIGLIRQMSPEERLRRCLDLNEGIRIAAEASLRAAYPAASEREIFLRAARQRLGPQLFHTVYGDAIPHDGRI